MAHLTTVSSLELLYADDINSSKSEIKTLTDSAKQSDQTIFFDYSPLLCFTKPKTQTVGSGRPDHSRPWMTGGWGRGRGDEKRVND